MTTEGGSNSSQGSVPEHSADAADPFTAWHGFMSACCVFLLGETVLLAVFVHRNRHKQEVRLAGTVSLFVLVAGSSILALQPLIVVWLEVAWIQCLITIWTVNLGSWTIVTVLSLQAWRIAVVLDYTRLQRTNVSHSEVHKRLALLIASLLIYLIICTFLFPVPERMSKDNLAACSHVLWDYVAHAAIFSISFWGMYQCYRGKKAPKRYNLTRYNFLQLYNVAVCLFFYIINTYGLIDKTSDIKWKLSNFLFVVMTVPLSHFLLFKRYIYVSQKSEKCMQYRLVARHVDSKTKRHYVTITTTCQGDVQEIVCDPCGLLLLGVLDDPPITNTEKRKTGKEVFHGYTEDDLDRLIVFYEKAKQENSLLKQQMAIIRQQLDRACDVTDNLSQATTSCTTADYWLRSTSQDTISTMATADRGRVHSPIGANVAMTSSLTIPSETPSMFPLTRLPKSHTFSMKECESGES